MALYLGLLSLWQTIILDFWPGDSKAIWLESPGIFLFHRKEIFDVEPTNTAERELESKTEEIPLGAYRGRSRIIVQDLTPPANFHNTFQEFPRPKALLAFLEARTILRVSNASASC